VGVLTGLQQSCFLHVKFFCQENTINCKHVLELCLLSTLIYTIGKLQGNLWNTKEKCLLNGKWLLNNSSAKVSGIHAVLFCKFNALITARGLINEHLGSLPEHETVGQIRVSCKYSMWIPNHFCVNLCIYRE
jgi:hypothetical protein